MSSGRQDGRRSDQQRDGQRGGRNDRDRDRSAEARPVTLGTPPRLRPGALRVVALGGIGEIGRNMTVYEIDGRLLIVDCGVLFPEDGQPGVDLILPDLRLVEDRLDDIDAVVITHGHEDHIGALPWLLRQRSDLPVLGARFSLALIAAKCKEHRIKPNLRVVTEGERLRTGPWDLQFFAVNHSIPDALAVGIRTQAGTVLHTGDIKLDQLPLDGRLTDLGGFAQLGQEGVDLFCVDSTNAEVPGFVAPERDIGPVLESYIGKATQRVIVASFASHVHRVQQMLDAAHAHGRKVAFVGRSMVRNMQIAQELGLLTVPDGLVRSLDKVLELPPNQVLLISTGSQGEPLSALSRMSRGEHRSVNLEQGDTVILASSMIPGNETSVFTVINELSRVGVTVIHQQTAKVHVSGHASAGELLFLYNAVRPRNVIPVHGEWRHLRAQAKLAVATGVPADRVVLAPNGTVVDLVDGKARAVGQIEVGMVYVDGNAVGDVNETTLSDRLILGEGGFIAITVAIDSHTGRAVASPTIAGRGFSDDPKALDAVVPLVEAELARTEADGITDTHRVAQAVRRVVGRWVGDVYRRRPMIVPTVLAV
ncbi:ribonuclease J [Nakamurella leprariae]|uniref:Ribonuclease J n=1 Tax=Nakamurella leprariae TaxID=2803911 RepID=A0A939C129_9ACTN|nr:ribonuclease J [Nakamurella leprariae]MBM9466752.1 ribonuclease J [Nakamurella leprariae]